MSMAYIREAYDVPAKRGGRVEFTGHGKPQQGTILSARDGRLTIKLDDYARTLRFHPTWKLRYLEHGPVSDPLVKQ